MSICRVQFCSGWAGPYIDGFCTRHWSRLPHGLQAALIKNYRKGEQNGDFTRFEYYARKAVRLIDKQFGRVRGFAAADHQQHQPADQRGVLESGSPVPDMRAAQDRRP